MTETEIWPWDKLVSIFEVGIDKVHLDETEKEVHYA